MVKQKDKWLLVRITAEEKEEILALAKDNGFDNLSAFVLWAIRKQKVLKPITY